MTPPIRKIGLIAGEGKLPIYIAENAIKQGIEVVAYTFGWNNRLALSRLCQGKVYPVSPGLLDHTHSLLVKESIEHVVFAGKVDKWILLRNPRLDKRAIRLIREHTRKNDDNVMQVIINELKSVGIGVLNQTDYLENLLQPPGLFAHPPGLFLTEAENEDIAHGFKIAKTMGQIDVGQTIVIHQGMVLAVEAIEGTDQCLKRAGKLSKKPGGIVVKVAKPLQDQRFDVPAVGLRTLNVMKKAGLKILATEAHRTLFLDPEAMALFAEKNQMIITSVSQNTP
ncbi:MAG: UDP-2,3-diacylglucosamine diphosphatase LpxI [Cyanobacteria bacterium]|nr:UDP-2,3-diacylglucosamine diphosphatase LpxI [Cyanobacteriota bacterium]